jgi:hypothetical protein
VREEAIGGIESFFSRVTVEVSVDVGRIGRPRTLPQCVTKRKRLEDVLYTWPSLTPSLHPSLPDLFQVECGRIGQGMHSRWGNMKRIAVRTARDEAHYDPIGRRHVGACSIAVDLSSEMV